MDVFESSVNDSGSQLGHLRRDTAAAVQALDAQQLRRRTLRAQAHGPLKNGHNTVKITLTYRHGDALCGPDTRTDAVSIDDSNATKIAELRPHTKRMRSKGHRKLLRLSRNISDQPRQLFSQPLSFPHGRSPHYTLSVFIYTTCKVSGLCKH